MEATYLHINKVVEVFKTNVTTEWQSRLIIFSLNRLLPQARINFDLDDCDKILRIEMEDTLIDTKRIIEIVNAAGFHAGLLR